MVKPLKTIDNTKLNILTQRITELLYSAGFDDIGVCKPKKYHKEKSFFNQWTAKNYHADMEYLTKYSDVRFNTKNLMDNTKSVVVVLKNYFTRKNVTDKRFSIAKYALYPDYHKHIKSKLKTVLIEIKKTHPEVTGRYFVDTAPILERANATESGLGFIGKNKCLISHRLGSFTFIGILALNCELNYNKPDTSLSCEDCIKCIKACPTGALSSDGLDASKCISYHTVENKKNIPYEVSSKIGNRLFGCDTCQLVCPYNADIKENSDDEFQPLKKILNLSEKTLSEMSDSKFNTEYKNTSLLRAGRKKLLENFLIISPNTLNP